MYAQAAQLYNSYCLNHWYSLSIGMQSINMESLGDNSFAHQFGLAEMAECAKQLGNNRLLVYIARVYRTIALLNQST